MRVSPQGFAFIQSLEGFVPRAVRIDAGRFVVGFRHTRFAKEGLTISLEDAENLLRFDLFEVETFLSQGLTRPLAQAEFDALVSLAFDIGLDRFARSPIFARMLEGDLLSAAQAFDAELMTTNDVRLRAKMLHRRTAEKALFLSGSAPQDPLLRFKSGSRAPLELLNDQRDAPSTPTQIGNTPRELRPVARRAAELAPDQDPDRATPFAQERPKLAVQPVAQPASSVVPFQPVRPSDPIARVRQQMIAAAQAAKEAQAKALPQGAPIPPLREAPPALAPLAPMAASKTNATDEAEGDIWPRALAPMPIVTLRTETQPGSNGNQALNWLHEQDFSDPQLTYEVHVGDAARTVSDPPETFVPERFASGRRDPLRAQLMRPKDGRQILTFVAIGSILAGCLYIGYVPIFFPHAPAQPSAMLILGGIVCLVLARGPDIRAMWRALADRFSPRNVGPG